MVTVNGSVIADKHGRHRHLSYRRSSAYHFNGPSGSALIPMNLNPAFSATLIEA